MQRMAGSEHDYGQAQKCSGSASIRSTCLETHEYGRMSLYDAINIVDRMHAARVIRANGDHVDLLNVGRMDWMS